MWKKCCTFAWQIMILTPGSITDTTMPNFRRHSQNRPEKTPTKLDTLNISLYYFMAEKKQVPPPFFQYIQKIYILSIFPNLFLQFKSLRAVVLEIEYYKIFFLIYHMWKLGFYIYSYTHYITFFKNLNNFLISFFLTICKTCINIIYIYFLH